MMIKAIVILVILAAGGWYGYTLYKHGDLPAIDAFIKNMPVKSAPQTALETAPSGFKPDQKLKCTTKDGSVIYGIVPPETVCVKQEAIKGSVTIMHNMGGAK